MTQARCARPVGDDAVGLGGYRQFLDDRAAVRIEEDDTVFAINGDGGQGAGADPGDAFGLVADLEFRSSTLRAAVSTTVTVPLSGLATRSRCRRARRP